MNVAVPNEPVGVAATPFQVPLISLSLYLPVPLIEPHVPQLIGQLSVPSSSTRHHCVAKSPSVDTPRHMPSLETNASSAPTTD
ncbi:MAG: hypothetical protein KTR29_15995 [Rhodothermaceae bacterium]|nr:hypothetical protein [Rhodothermaceae bacterium]